MSAADYVNSIVNKYGLDASENSNVDRDGLQESRRAVGVRLPSLGHGVGILCEAHRRLELARPAAATLSLFISLTSNCKGTMKDLYEGLNAFLTDKQFTVKRQKVSLGIRVANVAIDFLPGKHQAAAAQRRGSELGASTASGLYQLNR